MLHPEWGPFVFDTSAESWIARSRDPAVLDWFRAYLSLHSVNVSAITVLERVRGYAMLRSTTKEAKVEEARSTYLNALGRVLPLDGAIAVVAAEIIALLPNPPTPPRRTHQYAESRHERLVRWRFDCMIAATALVAGMLLVHNDPADFEAIRSAIETSPERFPKLGPLGLIRCDSLT